mmetsp:Transcript_127959/g.409969  ORF Transcript_127959/g.409969 Transcript_127959/m.409969 type:complete len:216 (+) Transcript_127959:315-962(+)
MFGWPASCFTISCVLAAAHRTRTETSQAPGSSSWVLAVGRSGSLSRSEVPMCFARIRRCWCPCCSGTWPRTSPTQAPLRRQERPHRGSLRCVGDAPSICGGCWRRTCSSKGCITFWAPTLSTTRTQGLHELIRVLVANGVAAASTAGSSVDASCRRPGFRSLPRAEGNEAQAGMGALDSLRNALPIPREVDYDAIAEGRCFHAQRGHLRLSFDMP